MSQNIPANEDYLANLLAAFVDDARELELHAKFLPHIHHRLNCRLDQESNIVYVECVTCDKILLDLQGDQA